MKAQNLTICVPNKGCDKNCPYCVSKMTPSVQSDLKRMEWNLKKVKFFAERAGVSSILFTGKGEPFLNIKDLTYLANLFSFFPIEIQTNGLKLLECYNEQELMIARDILWAANVLAFSFDRMEQFDKFKDLFEFLKKNYGIVIRVTMNVTEWLEGYDPSQFIGKCQECGVDQFSFRNIVVPTRLMKDQEAYKAARWIDENTDPLLYNNYKKFISKFSNSLIIRELPYGAVVYDICDVAVTCFDYCVQDKNNGDDIRSLIFQEDGHLYTSWNSKASILF